jgi:pyrimidine-nucleoside phosphorylase
VPTTVEIIEAKRDGRELPEDEIRSIVLGFTAGKVPDYQMSAFLMAVYLKGMTTAETVSMTRAMVDSGETLDLSAIPGIKLDKHSTGGVGDKVSLAFVAILAAAGVPVAKMSGRGLGITGGTLDKLESISGFQVELSSQQIVDQVSSIGACICAQTKYIAPADKGIYALRDVTGTVESSSLVASSVMSKKIAGGADTILLDVKYGRGAFMKSYEAARTMALLMRDIGIAHGKQMVVEMSSMDIPLGRAVGNLIEVKEAADFLRNAETDARLKSLIYELAQKAILAVGNSSSAVDLVESGKAWSKFVEIVEAQGGDVRSIERWNDITPAAVVRCTQSGFVTDVDAEIIGRSSNLLGAGRAKKDDSVDHLAGIRIDSPVGQEVETGSILATLYGCTGSTVAQAMAMIESAFRVDNASRAEIRPQFEQVGDALS